MTEPLLWTLITVGLCFITLLLWYIRKQITQLRTLKEEQIRLKEQAESKQKALQLDVIESIKVIAKVMLDDQVDLSEGCLRIKVLIDNYDPSLHENEKYSIFSLMADELAHMPTHGARKQIEKKLLFKLDTQRLKLEAKHREEIRRATKALLSWLERPLKVVE